MPAVLDRPAAPAGLIAELRRPPQQPQVLIAGCTDGAGSDLPAVVVDRDDGVSVLVRIDPEDDHGCGSLPCLKDKGTRGRPAGTSQSGAMPRSSQATSVAPVTSGGPHNGQ